MEPSVYDHHRVGDGADGRSGVYRVVGVDDESGTVTLLRVGDSDGGRVTGEPVRLPRERFDSLGPAENPDENRGLADSVASFPETAYWSVRAFAVNSPSDRSPLPSPFCSFSSALSGSSSLCRTRLRAP